MKIMYLMKRAKPDVEVPIASLSLRMNKANENDLMKLKRVLCWLKQTIDEKRIIGSNSMGTLFTWVDVAYAVHARKLVAYCRILVA